MEKRERKWEMGFDNGGGLRVCMYLRKVLFCFVLFCFTVRMIDYWLFSNM